MKSVSMAGTVLVPVVIIAALTFGAGGVEGADKEVWPMPRWQKVSPAKAGIDEEMLVFLTTDHGKPVLSKRSRLSLLEYWQACRDRLRGGLAESALSPGG